MSRELRLRPELLDDVTAGFTWYEAAAGLGHEFLRSYFAALAVVERQPTLFRKVHRNFRRVLLTRFPYAIYFRIERSYVMVFLLVHGARDPATVRGTLRDRQ